MFGAMEDSVAVYTEIDGTNCAANNTRQAPFGFTVSINLIAVFAANI